MRILLVCGSQRTASLNARLLQTLASALPDGIEADVLHPHEVALPLYSGNDETDPLVLSALCSVHTRFAEARALIIACPEFNGLMPAYFKNLIDWVSRLPRIDASAPNAFLDKPALLASATPGWSGGAVGIPALRALLGYVGALPFGETITLPYAGQAWREDGSPNPEHFGPYWQPCLGRFVALAARMAGERA